MKGAGLGSILNYLAMHFSLFRAMPREKGDQLLCCCTAAVYRAGVTSNDRRNGKDPVRMRSTVHPQSFTRENRSQMHNAGRHARPEVLLPTAAEHFTECFLIVSNF